MTKTIAPKLWIALLVIVVTSGFAFGRSGNVSNLKTMVQQQADNALSKDLGDFTVQLPNETWRLTSKSANSASNNVEFIYGDRLDGFLQIRRVAVDSGSSLADMIDREQNQKLQFLSNFVNGKDENFKGNLGGKVVNYEFTQSGKQMSGRVYFLQDGEKNLYILRFTGYRDKLKAIRNQTDAIARTFKLKNN